MVLEGRVGLYLGGAGVCSMPGFAHLADSATHSDTRAAHGLSGGRSGCHRDWEALLLASESGAGCSGSCPGVAFPGSQTVPRTQGTGGWWDSDRFSKETMKETPVLHLDSEPQWRLLNPVEYFSEIMNDSFYLPIFFSL